MVFFVLVEKFPAKKTSLFSISRPPYSPLTPGLSSSARISLTLTAFPANVAKTSLCLKKLHPWYSKTFLLPCFSAILSSHGLSEPQFHFFMQARPSIMAESSYIVPNPKSSLFQFSFKYFKFHIVEFFHLP